MATPCPLPPEADKTKLYVYNAGVTNTISFVMDSVGRTNINLNSADTGYYWKGSVSTEWNNAANWTNGKVPTLTDNIIIPSTGVTYMPVISTATAYCNRLTLQSGATLRVDSVLQLNGDFNILGTLTGNGMVKTASNSTTPFNAGLTWNVNVEYNRNAGGQTILKGIYKGLSINAANAGST